MLTLIEKYKLFKKKGKELIDSLSEPLDASRYYKLVQWTLAGNAIGTLRNHSPDL